MSLFGGIFHSIGNFFDGNEDEKKKQQQQQAQQQSAPTTAIQHNPVQNNAPAEPDVLRTLNSIGVPLQKANPTGQSSVLGASPFPQPDTLVKAQPPVPAPTPPPTVTPKPQTSFLHKLTHNPVTNLAGGVVKGVAQTGEAVTQGENNLLGLLTHQKSESQQDLAANLPSDFNKVINTGYQGTKRQIAGAGIQTATAALAPEVGGLVENAAGTVAGKVLPEAASRYLGATAAGLPSDIAEQAAGKTLPLLSKFGGAAATGAVLNTVNGVGTGVSSGLNPGQILKKIPQNAAVGAALGLPTPLLGEAVAALRGGAGESEIADGVSSVNPTKEADAAAQAEAANPTPVEPTPVETPVTPTTERPFGDVQKQIEEANNAGDAAKVAQLSSTLPAEDQISMNPDAGLSAAEKQAAMDKALGRTPADTAPLGAEPVTTTPTPVAAPAEPVVQPPVEAPAPVAPEVTTPATPAHTAEAVAEGQPVPAPLDANGNPVLQSDKTVAQAAEAAGVSPNQTPVALDAPKVRAAYEKQLGDVSKQLDSDGQTHDVLSNPELTQAGKAVVDTMGDNEILTKYSSPVKFVEPGDVAQGNAALQRLTAIVRSGESDAATQAQKAIDNIIDAASEVQSRSGRVLNFGQEMLDNLPPELKVPYYIKHIDDINAARYGEDYTKIADDPAQRAAVEAQLTGFLIKDEQLSSQIADQQSILSKGLSADTRSEVSTEQLQQAAKAIDGLKKQQELNAGEMTQYYDSKLPGRTATQKAADWQRTSMLSSTAGRLHALLSTSANVSDQAIKEGVSGVLGKVHNALVGPSKAIRASGPNLPTIVKGAFTGLKKSANEARGKFQVENAQQTLKDNTTDNSSQLTKYKGGAFKRVVRAATGLHTNLTQGIKDSEILRDAKTEATQQGLSGAEAEKYVISRSAQPSAQMIERANEVHAQLNNLNDNPFSKTMTAVGNAAEKNLGPVGSVVKNQILPFPRFLGGQLWNAITDKNVVAASIKAASSALKGDTQGFVDNISNVGVEGGKAYALGWVLTKNGILTNKDAAGNTYDGVYVHIGDRYVPATTFGFFAPSIILGNAAYNGFNDPKSGKGNFATNLGKTAVNTLNSAYHALSGEDVLGAGNNISEPIDEAFGNNKSDPSKLIKIGTNVAGQNIPAFGGDVNSVLNQTSLNPTHEAAQTTLKKTNPATGLKITDNTGSAKAQLLNKVPIASQKLPRQPGVASADLLDRTLASTRETGQEQKANADAQAKTNQANSDKIKNVPDPNGKNFSSAVEARIEDGNYDAAIEGLNQKISANQKDSTIPKSTTQKLKDQVKQLQVTKNGGFQPDVVALYKKTSLSEWRDMGDPDSDNYDQKTYDKLYAYDSALAKSGVSANTTKGTENKYSAKKTKSGSGSSSNSALSKVKSNTLGSTPSFGNISFGDLAPEKITDAAAKIPTIQQIKAGDLIKKRTISVGRAT